MKIYGCSKDSEVVKEMREVSIQATAEQLRAISRFLLHAANEIETKESSDWSHQHLADFLRIESDDPEFIIAHPDSGQ